jgi:hypothetical protein
MSNRLNSSSNSIDSGGQSDRNNKCGDLSDWQYLTENYDDDQKFANDADSLQPFEESVCHHYHTVPMPTSKVTISTQHSDQHNVFKRFAETNVGILGFAENSGSFPNVLMYDQVHYPNKCTAMPSSVAKLQHIHHANTNMNADSHPRPAMREDLSPHEPPHRQTEHTPFKHKDQGWPIDDFYPNQLACPLERVENDFWINGLFHATEPNQFHDHYRRDQLMPTRIPIQFTLPTEESYTLEGQHQTSAFEPTPIHPLRSLINSANNGNRIDPIPDMDMKFESTSMPHAESKPHARNLNPTAIKPKEMNESTIATNAAFIDAKAAAYTSSFQARSLSTTAMFDRNRIVTFFTATEQEEIYIWMKMPMPMDLSMQQLPPYEWHRNKKLLLRYLTPYNYYFRDERDNIVGKISNDSDPLPPPTCDFSPSKLKYLLYQHWYVDPLKKKRRHRKSHGKIDFLRLSKAIADRWHQLPDRGRDFYYAVAQCDTIYYHHHLKLIQRRPDIV